MRRYRSFIFPGSEMGDGVVRLEARESRHLLKVLRARAGDAVDLLDGLGTVRRGRLRDGSGGRALVGVESVETIPAAEPPVTLLVAVAKGKAMDLILRMATEIGVSCLQPVFTEHSEVKIDAGREASKLEKWELVLVEACKQCGLPWLPELKTPVALKDWCAGAHPGALRIVASLEGGSRPLRDVLDPGAAKEGVVLAVGPEGDFSEREYRLLRENGFRSARLGAQVLRAETAVAYVLSVADQVLRS